LGRGSSKGGGNVIGDACRGNLGNRSVTMPVSVPVRI
jgi:hypothetical protein